MYLLTILCAVYHVHALVPQGVCQDIRGVYQKPGASEKGNGHCLVGLQILCEFCHENECQIQGSRQEDGRTYGKSGGKLGGPGAGTGKDRHNGEECWRSRKKSRRIGEADGRPDVRGNGSQRGHLKEYRHLWAGGAGRRRTRKEWRRTRTQYGAEWLSYGVAWLSMVRLRGSVWRRLAVRQARVRFSARHHREVFPTELTNNEQMKRGPVNGDG
jgi:hypothetical protein